MSRFMTQCTSLNPPVLETSTSVYSLIERRQFTDMIELANHILFLAQMQTRVELAGQILAVLERWILRGDLMPNQFIYETADLFASVGYRFHVVQWTTREQAFDQLLSASNSSDPDHPADPRDVVLGGSRIHQAYTSFTPGAMNNREGKYHDSNVPQQQLPRHFVYKSDPKIDFNCIGCPSCDFCTKVKKDMLKHEQQHWDPVPCICARQNQKLMAAQLDTRTCQCGRLIIDEGARMTEAMPMFTHTTAIQLQRDHPNMGDYLNINS
ncbi:hypothetical protein E4T44_00033 [Aureobasidium sp. EXF-8845]|nr:hypothetical protein E4T44_00033 [Aureobasidium sp. EXF-8845]KAI4858436.1 hypothetical protein E4T45_00050 [Aureobasidium sp. EXF-8846]